MDTLTIQDLQKLVDLEDEQFISIYMPTYSSGVDIRQNPVRLKQLLRKAEAELYNLEMRKEEIEILLKPGTTLVSETRFWQNQSEGLALFIHSDGIEYFRLPISFKESMTISNKIYIKPLLPLFSGNGQFNILALSKNENRLFRCTRQNIVEIELKDGPENIYDMKVDDDPKTRLLLRISSPTQSNGLIDNMVSQGQANENDYEKNKLTKYFRAIDKALLDTESNNVPLILAGVDYLIPIYREKSNHPYIVKEFIKGNPENLSPEQIHEKAWKIVEPIFTKDQEKAKEMYNQYSGQRNNLYLNTLDDIIPAAYSGQVEFLFLDNEIDKWGKFDHKKNKIEIHEKENVNNEDLMEYVSILTLSRGGKVFAMDSQEIPDEKSIAAVLRY
ncbi:MAG TPA: hypothetical protein VK087_02180 [Tissierellaceae bacterium]|nr:hypothetical protein [Tissierellaceae bacterium]